jgi:hypothetical protein
MPTRRTAAAYHIPTLKLPVQSRNTPNNTEFTSEDAEPIVAIMAIPAAWLLRSNKEVAIGQKTAWLE